MLLTLAALSIAGFAPALSTGVQDCASDDYECLVENGGTFVGVGGKGGRKDDPGYGIGPPPDAEGDGSPGFSQPPNPITLCNTDDDTFPVTDPLEGGCVPGNDDTVTIPYPTLSDLARFMPEPPTLSGEPLNAGVLGKPTNFLSTASEHTLDGELFGYPVSVRFAPVEYTFDYGDGTTATVTDAYDSWAEMGLGQFTPTAASHTYSAKGEYDVNVTVSYSAAVNFWGSDAWLPVDGYVRASASGYGVTIYEVVTALVDKDCTEDPAGIGCP